MSVACATPAPIDVSVVIPTYRRPGELRDAIASALGQTGVRVEVLVVDDNPAGEAQRVVEGFADARIRYLRTPVPSGGLAGRVRNVGWPHATGRFVHFLDDDDLVPAGHYAAAVEALSGAPQAGMVFGRVSPFGDIRSDVEAECAYFADARRRALTCRRFGPRWGFAACMLFDATLLVCSAAVIRRECIAAIGGFDAALRVNEDVDFYARVIRQFGALFIDQVSLYRRVGPSLIRQDGVERHLGETYRHMHSRYRTERGVIECLALKLFARSVMKVM